jgi:hypothetical protein
MRPLHPTRIAPALAVAALNILWQGHGVFRGMPLLGRFLLVALITYLLTTVAEFVWLALAPLPPPSIQERLAAEPPLPPEPIDPLVETLREVPPAVLKEGTLQLAEEMRTFEAEGDKEFVTTLLTTPPAAHHTEEQLEEALDKQSAELMQTHITTWRTYRDRFYRPARAFRDELRRRLGIRNTSNEPHIPALDQAILTGANPISDAADHLVALARRLK